MSSIANTVALKERLLKWIEKLPEADIQEVLDFVEFLQTKRHKIKSIPEKAQLNPEKDPILKIIGIADVEPFADKIDQELYGE
jgi:hypothetical protein